MKRFYFVMSRTDQWYEVMRECRQWFGTNWRSQPKVRRKPMTMDGRFAMPHHIWFEVPDERFATWISVKMALEVISEHGYPIDYKEFRQQECR